MKAEGERQRESGWAKFFHVIVDRGVWACLSGKARVVYIVLLRHIDDITRNCWPGIGLIAREAGIHVRNVSAALAELERCHLIKRWRKRLKNFYRLYPADMLKDLLPQKMDVSVSPQKMDVSPLRKRRNVLGRFMPASVVDEPAPALVDRSHPSAVEAKKSSLRRDLEEEKEKKNMAGSATASAGASAEPAGANGEGEELIPGRLTRRAFSTNQWRLKAWDRPNKEMDFWMRKHVGATEEEMRGVYAREYPDWKPAQGNGAG